VITKNAEAQFTTKSNFRSNWSALIKNLKELAVAGLPFTDNFESKLVEIVLKKAKISKNIKSGPIFFIVSVLVIRV
jgi:hypothetical protein